MKVTRQFMSDVQSKGWYVIEASDTTVTVGCPVSGCDMAFKLAPGSAIPGACKEMPTPKLVSVESYRDVQVFVRERRQQLGMTHDDAGGAAGLAHGHWAKFEKDDPARIPTIDTIATAVRTLGWRVVLMPDTLFPTVMARIADTREGIGRRMKWYSFTDKQREAKASPPALMLPPPDDQKVG